MKSLLNKLHKKPADNPVGGVAAVSKESRGLSIRRMVLMAFLLAAVVLFGFGTGAVKGFAVTLSVGIITSMFTAIMVTRALVNLIYGRKRRLSKVAL